MKNYRYFKRLSISVILLLSLQLIVGCKSKLVEDETVNFNIIDFNLDQLDSDGNIQFNLKSKEALIDPTNTNINISKLRITLYRNSTAIYLISSKLGYFDRLRNIITLKREVILKDLTARNNSEIITDRLTWNLNSKILHLEGNIKMTTDSSKLIAHKAIYDQNINKINIYQIKKYEVYNYNNDLKTRPTFSLMSDKAILDRANNKLVFYSDLNKVQSKINLDR